MLFNSFHFLLFFIIVTSIYFALNHRYRWFLLLVASCYFYMVFKPIYILILGFTIVIDYFAGIAIEKAKGQNRKLFLIASLIANIGVLAVFKYFNFLNENLSMLLNGFGYNNTIPFLSILLPIGLSFHTFQAMSYTIEVYRGNLSAERNFGIYALYVMFYPQLVAGPIERPQNLLHQFYEKHNFDYARVVSGLRLMLWGFVKKVLIADRLAALVNQVYDQPTQFEGLPLILATLFFAFQIYCDFSAYTDIALGVARVMGFTLMQNFDHPYHAKSVSEFWKRWHISLSSWFRDYLYIPLGGNRVSFKRVCFNLLVVFLVSGLWHGAGFNFIIWGALHGFYIIIEQIISKYNKGYNPGSQHEKIRPVIKVLRLLITFSLVTFAWIFFRARTNSEAIYISTHLGNGLLTQLRELISGYNNAASRILFLNEGALNFCFGVILILLLELIHFFQRKNNLEILFNKQPLWVRWMVYYFTVISILIFGVFDQAPQFIYFQF